VKTIEFLSYLNSLGIQVFANGERLRINAPQGVLTPDLRTELAERKKELLAFLCQANLTANATPSRILPVSRDEHLPLSFAQQRLWFLDQLEPGDSTYNLTAAYCLSGPLNVIVLEQSFNEIVRRHEVLRTTISDEEGQPEQVIAEELRLRLTIEDLQELPETKRETEARRQVEEEAQRPFNLAQGPLLRASLLRLRPEEHLLQLTMHHIVSDGWSMGVLFEELASLYEAYASGKRSSLAELPIQYADFAVWQREWLQGEVLARQLGYWKQQLEGAPQALELPTDRPRTAVQNHQGATQSISLTKNLTDALKALSRQEGVTLYMTLLAAFKVLLHRYAGQDDIVVGSPIANRNRPEIEGLIGFFVNTLVLRTDLAGNPTFRELMARVREVALGAYAHQDLPFEKLVEELHPERDPSRTPLFQVMFVLQNTPGPALELAHLNLSPVAMENRTAKFDLTLSMREQGDRLRGTLNYNTALFDGATMKRLVGHLQVLLESIAADPEQRLSEVSILTAAERRQLLVEWNNTWLDYPKDECVHELFEAQAERTPEAVAVVFEEQQLTYGQLNSRANQLGHYLRKRGVGPEVIVGLCVERSLEMVVGLLGILKAGGAYVPLDPGYPTERLAFMLADTQAPVLLTQQHLVASLPKENVNIICLDTNWTQISQESQKVVVSEVKPHHQAYVIFTSGSTGRPKGVQIEHKSLLNLVYWHQTEFNVTAADRATQIASVAFDASVWELWPYLTVGASIYCPDEETRLSPEQLQDWLVSHGITISFLPTPLAEQMLMLNWPTDITLRTLLTGGDKLRHYPPTDLPFELVNNYGPTENSVVTTSGEITPEKSLHLAPSIGRPITNVQLYILDMNLQPVPIGVPGELYIGGSSLARGYLNRPELTAEQFIANPLTEEAGARLYKTGDLVRYLPDGTIEFIGRVDHQVKIRGFRIELGEIETVLGQHPAVQKNVILAREDSTGSKRLAAYVVLSREPAPTISELRKFLKQKLPGYMIPSVFVILDTLPLSPNGKVDHQTLPLPDLTRPELEAAHVAPQNEVEQTIADIWARFVRYQTDRRP
jgi:amino acid adenylation domain-containing protein